MEEIATPNYFITDWKIYNYIFSTILGNYIARSKEGGALKVLTHYVSSLGQV